MAFDLTSFLTGGGMGGYGGGGGGGVGSWLSSLFGPSSLGAPSLASMTFLGPGATNFATPQNSMYAYPGAPGPGPYAVPSGTPPPSAADLTTLPEAQTAYPMSTPYATPSGGGAAPGTQQAATATGGVDWAELLQQAAKAAGKGSQGGMTSAMGIPPEVIQAIIQTLQAAAQRRQSLIASMRM